MQFVIEATTVKSRSRFYNGVEKGRAKFHVRSRALAFDRALADKIAGQLAVVYNCEWQVVPQIEPAPPK